MKVRILYELTKPRESEAIGDESEQSDERDDNTVRNTHSSVSESRSSSSFIDKLEAEAFAAYQQCLGSVALWDQDSRRDQKGTNAVSTPDAAPCSSSSSGSDAMHLRSIAGTGAQAASKLDSLLPAGFVYHPAGRRNKLLLLYVAILKYQVNFDFSRCNDMAPRLQLYHLLLGKPKQFAFKQLQRQVDQRPGMHKDNGDVYFGVIDEGTERTS